MTLTPRQTTIPAAEARLLELFKAAVDPTTEVWPTRPAEDHQDAENVYLGDVHGSREWAQYGQPVPEREERYSIETIVEVYRPGTDSSGAQARAYEIALALEAVVANEPTLGGLDRVQWALVDRFQATNATAPEGVLAAVKFDVSVVARI